MLSVNSTLLRSDLLIFYSGKTTGNEETAKWNRANRRSQVIKFLTIFAARFAILL